MRVGRRRSRKLGKGAHRKREQQQREREREGETDTENEIVELEGKPGPEQVDVIDEKRERALISKIDKHIVPFLVGLYLFSFLDRVNIGNARLYGLEEDLGLTGNQYQIAVSILFIPYCLLEVPSNLVIRKFTASRYISVITTVWGLVATLSGITQNFAGLVVCRFILGAVEAGLFPGLIAYMTLFYGKKEIALRVGYLFSAAALAGACGGLLAYAIGFLDGTAGLKGWRWIMILEGIPSFLIGIATWFGLADDPETAYYLTEEDKELGKARRRREIGQTDSAQLFHIADAKEGAKDWTIYLFCLGQFGTDAVLYGYSTFLPTIIAAFGDWTGPQVQALTIPCYALGAITYLIVAWFSDRWQKRAAYTTLAASSSPAESMLPSDCLPPGCQQPAAIRQRGFATGLQLT
ncbi:high-affinity nicotinic acid transporter [Nannizzia gypsea CBS 118893]|uniref:High-affinity nicotinic acid transporter n=1 Tax=Arthroderma gypseum (strain ATCC MYA-4604 / CBS 118893) TaxID=535722 RepID=E5R2S3_ARTGP|nr:high-affinity nicotinic acid transporter [Nannizzia gypsea CBS 118893]EFQ97057.1 high-affinity nicotinic acid transporter [Nannizzia gypsea CBS 118893]